MRTRFIVAIIALITLISFGVASAESFRIAIMQDAPKDGETFKPIIAYLGKKGIQASFVTAPNYGAAAQMFSKGEVDAMFSGSGIAGTMIIKGIAFPAVRPVFADDSSSYWAVVVAKKGSPAFAPNAAYFKGKKVVFCGLASAGEFFFRSIDGAVASAAQMIPAPNHKEAINILNKGLADIAIVKNRVWDKEKAGFPALAMVGEDSGENPDRTLIVSKKTSPAVIESVTNALMEIRGNNMPEALAVREALKIRGFQKATAEDFSHTLQLLRKAGITPAFDFKF